MIIMKFRVAREEIVGGRRVFKVVNTQGVFVAMNFVVDVDGEDGD
jgi:hypothetical protein